MKYSKVYIDAIDYELPPVVVTSDELEGRLAPLYSELKISPGQLEAWTGIVERRWWPEKYRLSDGAIAAARKALHTTNVTADDIGAVVYCGVCREGFEPATACRVAAEVGARPDATVYDINNACLAMMNAMIEVANMIELGQIRAGLITSCESAREINDEIIARMLENPTMAYFSEALATLTGGSGAVAMVLTDGSFNNTGGRHQLLGGVTHTAPEHNDICRWGHEEIEPGISRQYMRTDALSVLKHGIELGTRTWQAFLEEMNWTVDSVDKVICHQVGQANQDGILKATGVAPEKDFVTFPFLGNIGTVSLPITAAIAQERGFLQPGDQVGCMGIGSGLNCLMLGISW
jgi:3-oxoacyl-[acyl-carrier-protein] synthase-3